jgi:hypothetical protein
MFGHWNDALRNIAWGADWMMKAHVTASDAAAANVFVGQVRLQHGMHTRPQAEPVAGRVCHRRNTLATPRHALLSTTPHHNATPPQIGSDADHGYFGRPEHNPTTRPVLLVTSATGGADVAGSYAAAFAATAALFREAGNATYAAALFKRAEQAFAFATTPAHQKK